MKLEKLYKYFPQKLSAYLRDNATSKFITELRLRACNNIQITENGKTKTMSNMALSYKELENILYLMCDNSINAYEDEISEGFITLQGGYRVGIGGEFYYSAAADKYLLRQITSLNIRIPKEAVFFKNQQMLLESTPKSSLIVGPPHSGKTSLIRIYSRYLSQKFRVCICDERREIFTDAPDCDVLQGVKKSTAISMATRTLNPQFIICDEIGTKQEAEEILSAVNTGVSFICSAHGECYEDILKRPNIKILADSGVFERIILLEKNDFAIREILNV